MHPACQCLQALEPCGSLTRRDVTRGGAGDGPREDAEPLRLGVRQRAELGAIVAFTPWVLERGNKKASVGRSSKPEHGSCKGETTRIKQ